jgi:hypothetical protein
MKKQMFYLGKLLAALQHDGTLPWNSSKHTSSAEDKRILSYSQTALLIYWFSNAAAMISNANDP